MKLLKLFLVLFVGFIAIIALTWTWIQRIAANSAAGPNTAVDIFYVVTRPLYLLELLVIVALAAWVCWRWVFA